MTDTATSWLRLWRESRGISIRDLERLTGINRGRLSFYERGVLAPEEDRLKIAKVLGGRDE